MASVDPWAIVRADHPNAFLMRYINREIGMQCFVRVERTEKNKTAELWDGSTTIWPSVGDFEREGVIAEADAAWGTP